MNTITRSRSDRLIAGVASGLASYLNVDPIIVRIGFVVFTMVFHVFGVVAYLALWLLMPSSDSTAFDTQGKIRENVAEMQGFADGIAERIRGLFARS